MLVLDSNMQVGSPHLPLGVSEIYLIKYLKQIALHHIFSIGCLLNLNFRGDERHFYHNFLQFIHNKTIWSVFQPQSKYWPLRHVVEHLICGKIQLRARAKNRIQRSNESWPK